MAAPIARDAYQSLSARQQEIAEMVATGKSNREIASTLFVSERTVEAHLAAISNKLGLRVRAPSS